MNAPLSARLRLFLVFPLCLLPVSCRRAPESPGEPAPAADEFSVMTYNLHQYALADRDGDGQRSEPKPQAEREAVADLIARVKPDVLAVQEIGNPTVFEEFRYALKSRGLAYEHVEYLQRGQSEINLAVLSRFPIAAREPHTDDRYSIGAAEVPVLRGFIDVVIEVNPQYRFRLMVAHLKSKVFHALGQTEMRRNEARLLNNHVRKVLKKDPEANLAVVGDFNDTYPSAALREALGDKRALEDLRPGDADGDVWTRFEPALDQYDRIDYILVSRGMRPEVVEAKTRVVHGPQAYAASDHRPVLAVFKAMDLPPAGQAATPAGRDAKPAGLPEED